MNMATVARLLGIETDQLRRAIPFFLVYLILFTALTMADAVAIALFTSKVGAGALPFWYTMTAISSLLLVGAYLSQATRVHSKTMFGWILGTLILLWSVGWALSWLNDDILSTGLLFVTREIGLTMVLMHFGTFLQDYFLKRELNQIFPVIYAGGRVGGIFGGLIVGFLAQPIGTLNLVLITIVLTCVSWLGILAIGRLIAERLEPEDELEPTSAETNASKQQLPAATRVEAIRGFLGQVFSVPLLFWLTITTLLFVICRWILAYQYTANFENHFADDVALAGFLGFYTQVALLISLFLQLFVVNRLVARLGVAKSHLIYTFAVAAGLLGNVLFSGLAVGVLSRFVEAELRFGLRNPLHQMLVNQFPKKMRIQVRGWSLGWLIPVGTLLASALIAGLLHWGTPVWVAMAGILFGILYLGSGVLVGRAYDRYPAKP
jgi:ATP/ADP translocase